MLKLVEINKAGTGEPVDFYYKDEKRDKLFGIFPDGMIFDYGYGRRNIPLSVKIEIRIRDFFDRRKSIDNLSDRYPDLIVRDE